MVCDARIEINQVCDFFGLLSNKSLLQGWFGGSLSIKPLLHGHFKIQWFVEK